MCCFCSSPSYSNTKLRSLCEHCGEIIQNLGLWPHNEIMVDLWCHKRLWRMSRHHKYNVPTIVCGSVAERGLHEKRGATHATRDAVFLMWRNQNFVAMVTGHRVRRIDWISTVICKQWDSCKGSWSRKWCTYVVTGVNGESKGWICVLYCTEIFGGFIWIYQGCSGNRMPDLYPVS